MKNLILVVLVLSSTVKVSAFTAPRGSLGVRAARDSSSTTTVIRTSIILFSTPPPKRIARRDLKKRRNKRQRQGRSREVEDVVPANEYLETRPLVRSISVEAGQDYWIDEEDLRKSLEREQAIKNRKTMEGEIPKEKLRTEVVAPYKQNWIGAISVFIIFLATIIQQFPDLLQSPIIPIPDL